MKEIKSDEKNSNVKYEQKSYEFENSNVNIDVQENDEYFALEKSKSNRRIIMYVFVLLMLGIQYKFSNYASNNDDSFGIMFALFALVNIFYPVVIAAGIIAITLIKRNLQNKSIFDSVIVLILTSVLNGIIPIIEFGKMRADYFRTDRIIFDAYLVENLLISIIGSLILRLSVINKARISE
ncbi:hypothetical protein ACHOLT_09180 [Desulfitobacterium sp. Sab5]|uniref:hypothetical protein n=1 Tax=Desulfitobacterium nosdiversum TaxID=3375356 RepID=UPI003CF1EA50